MDTVIMDQGTHMLVNIFQSWGLKWLALIREDLEIVRVKKEKLCRLKQAQMIIKHFLRNMSKSIHI